MAAKGNVHLIRKAEYSLIGGRQFRNSMLDNLYATNEFTVVQEKRYPHTINYLDLDHTRKLSVTIQYLS